MTVRREASGPDAERAGGFGGRPDVDTERNPWVTCTSEIRYENAWIQVRHDEVIDPSGRPGVYGVVSPRGIALGVLPIFDDATTILIGQYRYALDRYTWEMPEGGGAKDVDPLESIKRELREEAGLRAAQWHEVLRMHLSNSVTDEQSINWVAWELEEGEAEPDSTEELVRWRLPFRDAVAMVWHGEVTDSMTVATILAVEALRLRGELPVDLAAILR